MKRLSSFAAALLVAPLLLVTPAVAQPIDCGDKPTLACLAPHVFALARTQADSEHQKSAVKFAEEKLMPGDPGIALWYVVWDDPDPSEWDDIMWMARAGLFDQAIAAAEARAKPTNQYKANPYARVGGLMTVAWELGRQAQKQRGAAVLKLVEPDVAKFNDPDSDGEFALRTWLGAVLAQTGQLQKAIAHLHKINASAAEFDHLAEIQPADAGMIRQEAWKAAERRNEAHVWLELADRAFDRADSWLAATATRRAAAALKKEDRTYERTKVVSNFLRAGLLDEAGTALTAWLAMFSSGVLKIGSGDGQVVIPLLAQVGSDAQFEAFMDQVAGLPMDARAFGHAADQAFRADRLQLGEKFQKRAIDLGANDNSLHNLALMRARRGDVEGAFALIARMTNPKQARDVTTYVINAAIAEGHDGAAIPAISRLRTAALAEGDAGLMLKAAGFYASAGSKDEARRTLRQITEMVKDKDRLSAMMMSRDVVDLFWRLDGNVPAIRTALRAYAGTPDLQADLIASIVEVIHREAPDEAIRIASGLTDPNKRLSALERIARKLADDEHERRYGR